MRLRDTVRHYARLLGRRGWLIGLGVVVCTCATLGISFYVPPVYQASTLVQVNGSVITGSNDFYTNQALTTSYALLVTRDDVLQAAAQRLPGTNAGQLKQVVSDSVLNSSPMIEIRAQASTPQQAAKIANAVATAFVNVLIQKANANLQQQDSRLSQRLQAAKSTLDSAQTKLATIQAGHSTTAIQTSQRSQITTDQANYNALLDTYHRLQQRELQTASMLSIAQLANASQQPLSPNIELNSGVAATLSFLLMLALVLVLDWLDQTLKTEDDVAQLTGLTPLGAVPVLSLKLTNPNGLPIVNDKLLEDKFVAIGANVRAQCANKRTVLVTGIRAQAGISTTAIQLATALAHSGKRILLVDANLRRPTLHKAFESFHSYNLANCLADILVSPRQLNERVVVWAKQWKTPTPNLWLLPAGPASSQPATLLNSKEFRNLMEAVLAAQIVEMIVFDTANLYEGADALAVAQVAEATLLVIEAGKEEKEAVSKAQVMLERVGSPVQGVIINRRRSQQNSYFYVYPKQAQAIPAAQMEHNVAKNMEEKSSEKDSDREKPPAPIFSSVALPSTPQVSLSPDELITSGLLEQGNIPHTPPLVAQVLPAEILQHQAMLKAQTVHATAEESELHVQAINRGLSLPGLSDGAPARRATGLWRYLEENEQQQ